MQRLFPADFRAFIARICDPGILKATPVVCSRPKDRLKLFLSTAGSCSSYVLRWSKPKTRVIIRSEDTNLSLYDVQLPWYTDLRAMLSIKNKVAPWNQLSSQNNAKCNFVRIACTPRQSS